MTEPERIAMNDKGIEAAARATRSEGERDEPLEHWEMELARAAIAAYLAQCEADGFVMVPVEPSPSMLDAFVSRGLQVSIHGEGGWSEHGRNQWQQMIAARPKVAP